MLKDLGAVQVEAAACRACGLWEQSTQTLFGEGSPAAPLMLVGEQPGDQEELAAGRSLGRQGGF